MRQETYDAFVELQFQAKAEDIVALVGSDGSSATMRDVQIVAHRDAPQEIEAEDEGDKDEEEDEAGHAQQ